MQKVDRKSNNSLLLTDFRYLFSSHAIPDVMLRRQKDYGTTITRCFSAAFANSGHSVPLGIPLLFFTLFLDGATKISSRKICREKELPKQINMHSRRSKVTAVISVDKQ
jgi:hypothetical protein